MRPSPLEPWGRQQPWKGAHVSGGGGSPATGVTGIAYSGVAHRGTQSRPSGSGPTVNSRHKHRGLQLSQRPEVRLGCLLLRGSRGKTQPCFSLLPETPTCLGPWPCPQVVPTHLLPPHNFSDSDPPCPPWKDLVSMLENLGHSPSPIRSSATLQSPFTP